MATDHDLLQMDSPESRRVFGEAIRHHLDDPSINVKVDTNRSGLSIKLLTDTLLLDKLVLDK